MWAQAVTTGLWKESDLKDRLSAVQGHKRVLMIVEKRPSDHQGWDHLEEGHEDIQQQQQAGWTAEMAQV